MGKLRILSGSEVIKILEAHGFKQVRQEGSHVAMQKKHLNSSRTVTVPLHDTLAKGTLGSIIRRSGIPRKYFES